MESDTSTLESGLRDENNGGNDGGKFSWPTLSLKQNLQRPGFYLRLFNIVFYVILIFVYVFATVDQHHSDISSVFASDEIVGSVPQPTGGSIGTDGDLGFPITVNGAICTVGTLWSCVNEKATGECCNELINPDSSGPENTVSEHELIMIAIVVPFALIFARILLMAYLSVRYGTESWRTYSGFYSIDAAIGFFAALVFTEFFTSLCKKYVGSPRPNFYAYTYWHVHAVTGNGVSLDDAYESWASGHSSHSMAAGVYVAILLWRDLSAAFSLSMKPVLSAFLQSAGHLICIGIVYGYAFVGFTRIRDYWHHTVDVVTGWIIGAASAFVAFMYVTMGPYDLNVAFDKRKHLSDQNTSN